MCGGVDLRIILWYTGGVKKTSANANKFKKAPRTVGDILLFALVPGLLTLAGVFPVVAVFILPAALPLLYVMYRRFGPYLPLFCIVCYGATSLALDYNVLTVVLSVALLFAFCGIVISMQFAPTQCLIAVTVAATFAVVGFFCGVGIVRGAEGVPVADIAARYVVSERDDRVIAFFARDHYNHEKAPSGEQKLTPEDEGYYAAAVKSFSEWARDEAAYAWYYCIHYGAIFGFVAFFAALYINDKVHGRGNASCFANPRDIKMPRAFLWTMALPATVTGILLGVVGGYAALSATVMHAFCTVPASFGCFTLLCYFASLFKGRAQTFAYIVLVTVGIAAVLFPFTMFVLSVFGVCDCILNLRFWVDYLKNA